MIVPVLVFMKHLYQWARFNNPAETAQALANHQVTLEQALTINAKHIMLNPTAMVVQTVAIFAISDPLQHAAESLVDAARCRSASRNRGQLREGGARVLKTSAASAS